MADESITRMIQRREAGAWLRTERERRGLSQDDVARELGVRYQQVSNYERGVSSLDDRSADRIARLFSLPVIEVRQQVGLWIPADSDLDELRRSADPAQLSDDILVGELIRRYRNHGDREIVEAWPFRSNVPAGLWRQLISSAQEEIFLAGYTNYFFWSEHEPFGSTLQTKADDGCTVKILMGDPDNEVTHRREAVENAPLTVSTRIRVTLAELEKLGNVPNLEARFSAANADAHVSRSIFVFDSDMIVCEHIAERLGHGSVTFHLRRRGDNGVWDQYYQHADHLWAGGRPTGDRSNV